jgi:hypothetical protein
LIIDYLLLIIWGWIPTNGLRGQGLPYPLPDLSRGQASRAQALLRRPRNNLCEGSQ